MERLGGKGWGDLEREGAEGLGKVMMVESGVVMVEGVSLPSPSDRMAALSMSQDMGLGGEQKVMDK